MSSIAHARDRSTTDRVMRSAARGAALIGLAVVLGIVLLQVVDEGSGGGGAGRATGTTPTGNETTTTNGSGVRPPEQVHVIVLNGSGLSGAAATKTNQLRGLGYQMGVAGNASVQSGNTVACKTGFEAEAITLAATVGPGTQVIAFPATVPFGAETSDCIVIVGK